MRQKHIHVIRKTTSFILFFLFLACFVSPISAHAQSVIDDSQCGSINVPYFDSTNFKAPKDDYDVYVKLGKQGQNALTSFYVESSDAACTEIGSAKVSGDRWTKIGEWRLEQSNKEIRLELSSKLFTELPSANRPSVMLVSRANPVCVPEANCSIKINGEDGYVIPTGTLLNEDTLHVVRVVNPRADDVVSVNYFVDSTFVYSTKELQKFDMRYVPGGKHSLTRAIIYGSRQQVVIKDNITQSYVADFQNGIFRIFQGNRVSFQIILGLLSLAIILFIVLAIARYIHKRRNWMISHGIYQDVNTYPGPKSQTRNIELIYKYTTPSMYILGVTIAVLVVFITFNTYLVQFFKVHGVSMETTVSTDDQMIVNKLHKSWSGISGREYIPKRGQVIVFHKAQSQFLQEKNEKDVFVVKRVLGLPGERVVVNKGIVTVYKPGSKKGFNPDKNAPWAKDLTIDITEDIDVTLSESQIFVAGDNRPDSIDSRSNGPIPVNEIIGEAIFRVWPVKDAKRL